MKFPVAKLISTTVVSINTSYYASILVVSPDYRLNATVSKKHSALLFSLMDLLLDML